MLQIENIEEYITLKNQSSKCGPKTLNRNTLFVCIAIKRKCEFFTIFDSPCGPIDLHVRKDLSEPIVDLVKKMDNLLLLFKAAKDKTLLLK